MNVKINIDNRTVFRVLAVAFLFLFTVAFVSATKSAITLVVIAAFLAMALNPPVSYISSKITGGSRGAATAIAYIIVVGIIGFFLWAIVPPLVDQTREFVDNLPTYIDEASEGDNFIATFISDNNIDEEAQSYVETFKNGSVGDAGSRVFAGLEQVGIAIVSLLTVLVLTFFMLVEGPGWLEQLWASQPEEKRDHRRKLGHRMYGVITGYVNGQLLIALMAATASLIIMLILQLPLPLPLAGVVGLFGLIPLVGATLGSIIVILVALFQSVSSAIIMLIFFLVYQQIENNFIQPYIQSRTLDVSPLLIFISVLFGISLGGLLGAFIAIPAAACARILVGNYADTKAERQHKKSNPLLSLKRKKKD